MDNPDGFDLGGDAARSDDLGALDLAQVDLASTDQAEPACGVAHKACCNGATDADGGTNRGGACDATSACYPFSTGSYCAVCGADEQPCCGTTCTAATDVCRPTDNAHGIYAPTCVSCGGGGQPPCAGDGCWNGTVPNGATGLCQ